MGFNRSDHAFRFPKDAFADRIALYENFRHLENYLQFLGRGDKYATTIIVATPDSANAQRAHYVVEGVNDHLVMQDALDDVAETGGEVVFLEGTYHIDDGNSLVVPDANVTITGIGAIFDVAAIGAETGLSLGSDSPISIDWAHIVQGIKFTGGSADSRIINARSSYAIIQNCFFHEITASQVVGFSSLNSTAEMVVANNHFNDITLKDQTANGVVVFAPTNQGGNGLVTGNIFKNIQDDAVFGTYIVRANETAGFGAAVGNTIVDSTGLTDYFSGIRASHNIIDNVMIAGEHTLALGDLSDVGDGAPTNGDILVADGDSWEATPGAEWVSDQVGAMLTGNTETHITVTYQDADNTIDFVVTPSTINIDDLGDVVITTPSDGEVLTYDSGSGDWINDAASGGANALDDLTDVTITTPADGDVLTYDSGSTDWINTPLVALDIGEWEDWTPSLTNLNVGSTGTQVARYTQFGSTVFFYYHATLGGTGISVGDVQISVPVAEHANYSAGSDDRWAVGVATLIDGGTGTYRAVTTIDDGQLRPRLIVTSGTHAVDNNISSTTPFTWAAADRIIIQGFYEAAASVAVEGIVVPGSLDLDDLGDVVITGVADGEVLTYDSGSGDWVNAEASGGGSALFWKASSVGSYDDYFDADNEADWTEVAPATGTGTWTYNFRTDLGALSRGYHSQVDDNTQGDFLAVVKSLSGITTGDYIQTAIHCAGVAVGAAYNYIWPGLALTNGTATSSACASIDLMADNSGFMKIMITNGTLTAHENLHHNNYVPVHYMGLLHLRLVYSASNTFQGFFSINGEQWNQIGTDMSYTMTPTHGGFINSTWGGGNPQTAQHIYFHSNVTP